MISHDVSYSSRRTRPLESAPDSEHATRALFSSSTREDDALPTGTLLNVRYETLRVLGRGGFGITYETREVGNGNIFAIKEFFPVGSARENGDLVPGVAQTPERLEASRRRFIEEARVLSGLRHPNLVRVIGAFQERGTAFLVMEKLGGETLLQLVESRGALEEKLAVGLCENICDALDALHRVGFLHLDVKPENVIVCHFDDKEKRRAVLMDFDLLQRIESETKRDTQPLFHATHCGTPGYAPVEQYSQSAKLSRETDVYALGATLFHLLTGAPPPPSTDRAASGAPLSGPQWSELSEPVREAISQAMQVRPLDRPASIRDFQEILRGEKAVAVAPNAAVGRGTTTRRSTGVLRSSQLPKTPTAPSSAPPPTVSSHPHAAITRGEIYRLKTPKGSAVIWPNFCPCCGAAPDSFLSLKSEGETLRVPYCGRCLLHVAARKQGIYGAAVGILLGLSLAGIGFEMSSPFIGPLGIVVHFSAMCYGGLQLGFADKITPPQCCAVEAAVEIKTKDARCWKFSSGRYAAEFKKFNG